MNFLFTKKASVILLASLLISATFILSCKKDADISSSNQPPDLTTTVSASVSGFVTDENNKAVSGASVQAGTGAATSDKYGYFEIKNVQLVQNAAFVTVSKAGYFKGIKTFTAQANKSAFFRIKLIPKTIAGNLSSSAGGSVSLSNGLTVKLPANAVVNSATGVAYNGVVNVASYWINPTSTDLNRIMPGDLRAIDGNNLMKILNTYGMAAVELTSSAGEVLQLASGQKATLTFPIPASMQASAPANISLWYFDETSGLWKEQGTATKTGSTYVGDVTHFSFWNCDYAASFINLELTVLDSSGNPIPNLWVKVTPVDSSLWPRWGSTNAAGFVSGLVPDNQQLTIEIFAYGYGTDPAIYSQVISTTSSTYSLTIEIGNTHIATITGHVVNCSNSPVSNGYVNFSLFNCNFRSLLDTAGQYHLSFLVTPGYDSAIVFAEDLTALQQSASFPYVVTGGTNIVPPILACGISIAQFVNFTIDGGTPYTFTYPGDSLDYTSQGTSTVAYVNAFRYSPNYDGLQMSFNNAGIGVGSVQMMTGFYSNHILQPSIITPIPVNITEYGAVGQFVAGNFNGYVHKANPPDTTFNVVGSFRVRRQY